RSLKNGRVACHPKLATERFDSPPSRYALRWAPLFARVMSEEWCRGPESNWGHQHFQCCALPTELPRHGRPRCGRTLIIPDRKKAGLVLLIAVWYFALVLRIAVWYFPHRHGASHHHHRSRRRHPAADPAAP